MNKFHQTIWLQAIYKLFVSFHLFQSHQRRFIFIDANKIGKKMWKILFLEMFGGAFD